MTADTVIAEEKWQTVEHTKAKAAKIYTKTWKPQGQPTSLVTIVHGLGEHCSRYSHMAELFSNAGFAVTSYDQRGFGRTGKETSTFGQGESLSIVMNDLSYLLTEFKKEFPNLPHFLYGHSMGGCIVLYYIAHYDSVTPLSGVIASAPAIAPGQHISPVKYHAGKLFSKIIPSFLISSGLDNKDLSRDPQVRIDYESDIYNCEVVSLETAANILAMGKELLQSDYSKIKTPILIAHGTSDKMTKYDASKELFDKLTIEDKTFIPFEGYFHELHFEPEKDAVIASYIEWIKKRI